MLNNKIFITGGSGYVGKTLITELLKSGFDITALTRKGSENKIPKGCKVVTGNALDENSFADKIYPAETFIQLVGVSHPAPSKAQEFKKVDLVSAMASISAAKKSGVKHFVYLSVAHPAPIMQEYVKVRTSAEKTLLESGINSTIIRPWYILGPGHRWPYLFLPLYWVLKKLPSTKEAAKRLDLIKLRQIISSFLFAVENPPKGVKIFEAQEIKAN